MQNFCSSLNQLEIVTTSIETNHEWKKQKSVVNSILGEYSKTFFWLLLYFIHVIYLGRVPLKKVLLVAQSQCNNHKWLQEKIVYHNFILFGLTIYSNVKWWIENA